MQDDKNRVETILFTTGGFLGLEELSKLTDINDLKHLEKVIDGLVQDYDARDSGLEVVKQGDKWKLAIRKNYLFLTEKLLKDCDLDRPSQETLAVIAYKNPALQSDVIKIRGNKAYDHISNLKDLDFITADKYGRTRLLKVTQRFYDYFDVVAEQLKSKFEGVIPVEVKQKLDKMSEESMKEALTDEEIVKEDAKNEEVVTEKKISTEAFDNKSNSDDNPANNGVINKEAIIEEVIHEDVEDLENNGKLEQK